MNEFKDYSYYFDYVTKEIDLKEAFSRLMNVEFKESGGKAKSLCPFHDEKTPSFFVNPGEDGTYFYTCFGCHHSGNIITLYREHYSIDGLQALFKICNDYGIAIDNDNIDVDFVSEKKEIVRNEYLKYVLKVSDLSRRLLKKDKKYLSKVKYIHNKINNDSQKKEIEWLKKVNKKIERWVYE